MNLHEVLFVVGITGLALWHRYLPFYILSCLIVFFIGSGWFDTSWQHGIAAMLLACYLMYRAVMQVMTGKIGY